MANLKTEFNQFENNNYLKLGYKNIYKRLRNILNNSINPEIDLKEYVYTLMANVVKQNIAVKNRILTPKEAAERQRPCPTAIDACIGTMNFLKKICLEINPSFTVTENYGLKQEDFTSIIHSEVDKTTIYDSVSEYIEKEPYASLLNDVNYLIDNVPENSLYSDLGAEKRENLQDIYMKKEMAKQQMATHGILWKAFHKVFNRSLVKQYNEFIEKSEDLLKRCQFGNAAIQEAVNHYSSINDQKDDKGHLETYYFFKKQKEELMKKSNGIYVQNSVNVIRYDNAKMDEEKTNELKNKMSKIASKYPGMKLIPSDVDILKETCRTYDNTKDGTGFKDRAKRMYLSYYRQMITKQGIENLNIKEAMFDANKLTLLIMNKYTPIYEDPNLANILPELSFGTMTADEIGKVTKKVFPNIDVNVKDEVQTIIDEYKALDNVTLDKQSIGIEKAQVIFNEGELNIDNQQVVEEVYEVKETSKVNVV